MYIYIHLDHWAQFFLNANNGFLCRPLWQDCLPIYHQWSQQQVIIRCGRYQRYGRHRPNSLNCKIPSKGTYLPYNKIWVYALQHFGLFLGCFFACSFLSSLFFPLVSKPCAFQTKLGVFKNRTSTAWSSVVSSTADCRPWQSSKSRLGVVGLCIVYGGFLKWWVSPTTMGFPTRNDQHLGWFGGTTI